MCVNWFCYVCGGVREIGPSFFGILETKTKIVHSRYKFKKKKELAKKYSWYQPKDI